MLRGGSSIVDHDVVFAIRYLVSVFHGKMYYEQLGNFWARRVPPACSLSHGLLRAAEFGGDASEGDRQMMRDCEPAMRVVRLIYTCARLYFYATMRRSPADAHTFFDRGPPTQTAVAIPLPGETMLKAAALVDFCARCRDNSTKPGDELKSMLEKKEIPFGFLSLEDEYNRALNAATQTQGQSPFSDLSDAVYEQFEKGGNYFSVFHRLLAEVQKEVNFMYLDFIKLQEAVHNQERDQSGMWCDEGKLTEGGREGWQKLSTRDMMCRIAEPFAQIPQAGWERALSYATGQCIDRAGIEDMFSSYSIEQKIKMGETVDFLVRCTRGFEDGRSHNSLVLLVLRLRKVRFYTGSAILSPFENGSSAKRLRTE